MKSYRAQIYLRDGLWYVRYADGREEFCPNSCCKCCQTTDSQNDRFCDDCYSIAPFFEKHDVPQVILMVVGVIAMIKMSVEFFGG